LIDFLDLSASSSKTIWAFVYHPSLLAKRIFDITNRQNRLLYLGLPYGLNCINGCFFKTGNRSRIFHWINFSGRTLVTGVDPASIKNEYQECLLLVKTAGA